MKPSEAVVSKYADYICDGAKGPTTVAGILRRFLDEAARVEPTTGDSATATTPTALEQTHNETGEI